MKQADEYQKGEEACINGNSSEGRCLKDCGGDGRRWVGKMGVGVGMMVLGDTREVSRRKYRWGLGCLQTGHLS